MDVFSRVRSTEIAPRFFASLKGAVILIVTGEFPSKWIRCNGGLSKNRSVKNVELGIKAFVEKPKWKLFEDRRRRKVLYALKRGYIKKIPCHCGRKDVHMTHADFEKPLEVNWLCWDHFYEWRQNLRKNTDYFAK